MARKLIAITLAKRTQFPSVGNVLITETVNHKGTTGHELEELPDGVVRVRQPRCDRWAEINPAGIVARIYKDEPEADRAAKAREALAKATGGGLQ